jgi:LacI family transcriptional regulator
MKVTIRSVAKLAGVAPSTVSHYLNQTTPISPVTAQSVERAIVALNYRVNLGARSLRVRKTHSIGLVIPNISTPFFGELASVIENALRDRDYQTLLCISQRDVERELLQLANLVSRQVDGILLAYTSEQTKAIRFSREIAVPFVFIDRPVPGEYSVATDNYHGGQLAARHLAELGHRCIGMLCGEAEIQNEISRFLVPPLTTVGQPTSEMGTKAVDLLLQLMSHQAEDGNKVATNFLVAPTLYIRGSTATPSTNK